MDMRKKNRVVVLLSLLFLFASQPTTAGEVTEQRSAAEGTALPAGQNVCAAEPASLTVIRHFRRGSLLCV